MRFIDGKKEGWVCYSCANPLVTAVEIQIPTYVSENYMGIPSRRIQHYITVGICSVCVKAMSDMLESGGTV